MLTMKWLHLFWWPLWLSDNLPAASGRSLIGPNKAFPGCNGGSFHWFAWAQKAAFQGMHYSGGLDFSDNSCPWLHPIIETTLRKEATSLSTTDCCPKACPGPHPPSLVLVGPPSLESAASTSLGESGGTVTANLLRFHDPSHGQRFWHHITTALSPVSTSEVF